jgi:DDE family transposase
VPCTPANVAAFGSPPGGGSAGGWPQVRLVTVVACGTRGIIDADRNFSGYPVAAALAATGADLLIRAKAPAGQWLPVLRALPDGSYLSVLPEPASGRAHARARHRGRTLPGPPAGLPVRVIQAGITITPAGGAPRTEQYRLITTLLDARAAPATAIAACYAQRWEIETGYREAKVFTRGAGQVLRSWHPVGVAQEIWAWLCACQLTHAARVTAAASTGLDPDRISYTVTLRAIRRAIITPGLSRQVTNEALARLLPPRRPRSYPRLSLTSTAKRRAGRAGLTGTITCKITIIEPADTGPGP